MQIPSNLILSRVGAKGWLSFVIIAWGCIAVASAALQDSAQFMALRVLLGAAEAGTFPGIQPGKRLLQINAYHCPPGGQLTFTKHQAVSHHICSLWVQSVLNTSSCRLAQLSL